MNETYKLKIYFEKYNSLDDNLKKQTIIEECKRKYPSKVIIINRIDNILKKLNNKSRESFINNVFDVKNDTILIDLIDNIENQFQNKATNIETLNANTLKVISYNNFERMQIESSYIRVDDDTIIINNEYKKVVKIEKNDNRFYNNIVEKFLGFNEQNILLASNEQGEYLLLDFSLPNMNETPLVKEDALCDSREIQYYIDKLINNKNDRKKCLNRILLDLITNQNHRFISNGFGVINSDLFENNYYSLDDKTLKKEYAIDSLYRNYYTDIKDMLNLIVDNYEEIMKLIEDITKNKLDINKNYLDNLKNNIAKIYEKVKIEKTLDAIEFGTSIDIFNDSRNNNEEFLKKIGILRNSLNLKPLVLSRAGYVNIFTLVLGILLFGVMFAYLIISK